MGDRKMKKERMRTCGWCLVKMEEEKIDEHLEVRHGDFRHKRK